LAFAAVAGCLGGSAAAGQRGVDSISGRSQLCDEPRAAVDWPEQPADTEAGWLDLCCGTGRALIQAAEQLHRAGRAEHIALVGVDLVDAFDTTPAPEHSSPRLICADVTTWAPDRRFDLITCVHGLHYLGDKLATLCRAAGWLTDGGLLIADLDLTSIRLPDGRPAGRALTNALRRAGYQYDARRHRVTCTDRLQVSLPYSYLGADDRAGRTTPTNPRSTPTTSRNDHNHGIRTWGRPIVAERRVPWVSRDLVSGRHR
jgi:SAM-dependent methyltransferase